MLIYEIKSIPDLTLSKYQVFADSGIEGMLEAQLQFIKQLYHVALLGNIHIHFIYDYDPKRKAGHKLNVYVVFYDNNKENSYYHKLRKIVKASNVSKYFQFKEIQELHDIEFKYPCMSVLRKKERRLQTVIDNEEKYFYLIPNWEMNENARLYNMIQMMESFNEKCCYRVDLYTEKDLEEQIHKNFEKPLTFLRNISNDDRQYLSGGAKMQKNQRDPNADETLHQYEDWLKAIDSSSVFRCRICTFSKDEQYCQLLLNSTISESIKKGNATIKIKHGDFTPFELFNDIPKGYHLEDTPNSMKNWATTFTAEEISSFIRLPVLYDGENIELPKETAAIQENEGIILGKDKNDYDVVIPQELLPKHMFVCGVPGSGKTNTMLHLANSLWNYEEVDENGKKHKLNIPFLVLEPAKKEYRELALFDIPELLIFSPSACTNFPIKINPFEFPKGLTLSEHIENLCSVFEGAFPMPSPSPKILSTSIQSIYEKHGWNYKDINIGTKTYPTLSELYSQFKIEMQKYSYDGEMKGNIQAVLQVRIGSLLERERAEIFNVKKSTITPEEWLTKPVVIELESLGKGSANFLTLLLCTLIRETLKADPLKDKDKTVRHVIFIEEAHNLIAPESQVSNVEDSNPKIAATAFIVQMLAEVRALREGIIIADQLPTAMAPEVIKNTNIKLVHRLTAVDDRELVGSTMSASPLQMENMATYIKGQALFTYEKLLRPFEMRVSLVEEHGKGTPNDNQLYEMMLKKPAFFELLKKEEEDKYDELVDEVVQLVDFETNQCNELFDVNAIEDGIPIKLLEEYEDTCLDILRKIRIKKSIILDSIKQLSNKFIATEKIQEIQEVANLIGESFDKKSKGVIGLYHYKQKKRF